MFRKTLIGGLSLALSLTVASSVIIGAVADTRLADAAMQGDKAAVRTLLQQKADVNAPQGDGSTALHWAAYKDDVETAALLIKAGANVKAATRLGEMTPLFMAAKNGNAAMIDVLLKAGADPNTASSTAPRP